MVFYSPLGLAGHTPATLEVAAWLKGWCPPLWLLLWFSELVHLEQNVPLASPSIPICLH